MLQMCTLKFLSYNKREGTISYLTCLSFCHIRRPSQILWIQRSLWGQPLYALKKKKSTTHIFWKDRVNHSPLSELKLNNNLIFNPIVLLPLLLWPLLQMRFAVASHCTWEMMNNLFASSSEKIRHLVTILTRILHISEGIIKCISSSLPQN